MERHLKQLTELICLWTPDGRLAACNDAYAEFFGVSREQLIGRAWLDLVHGVDRESSAGFIEDYRSHPCPMRREVRVRHASGETRWLDWFHQPLLDASGCLLEVLSEGRDITGLKRAEQAARESEERYRRLFEQATEGMALVDADTARIEECNQAFLALTGSDRERTIGQPLPVVDPDGARDAPSCAAQLAAASESGVLVRAQLATRQGGPRDVDIKASRVQFGERTLVHAFFRDVTDERHAARYQQATLVLLRLLNQQDQTRELLRELTELLRRWTGCEAVAVRLREADDWPFSASLGFTPDFLQAERLLCTRDEGGRLVLDADGAPTLECLCGLVAAGRHPDAVPGFSRRGSFWTNNLAEFDRAAGLTRDACDIQGYQSLAVVPLRNGAGVLGVLQLCDRTPGRFTEALIDFLDNAAEQIAIALEQKAKLSSLEGGLRRIAALLAEIGVGAQPDHAPLPAGLRASLETLSAREMAVLRLLLHNRRPSGIARDLSRSVHTVRNQLKAIFRKLGVHSQEELLERLGTSADLVAASSTERRRGRRQLPRS